MNLLARNLLAVALLITGAAVQTLGGAPAVEITEVKNVGVSANDDAKSVIQVKWTVSAEPGTTVKSFEVVVELTYADGATEKARTAANGSARSARFEVPTLHISSGRPGAALKGFKASVTASFIGTATRQGSF